MRVGPLCVDVRVVLFRSLITTALLTAVGCPSSDEDDGSQSENGDDDGPDPTGGDDDGPSGPACETTEDCSSGYCAAPYVDVDEPLNFQCLSNCVPDGDSLLWCADDAACCNPGSRCGADGYCAPGGGDTGTDTDTGTEDSGSDSGSTDSGSTDSGSSDSSDSGSTGDSGSDSDSGSSESGSDSDSGSSDSGSDSGSTDDSGTDDSGSDDTDTDTTTTMI